MMDLQAVSTHHHIEYLNSSLNGHYVRIESEPLEKKDSKLIALDKAGEKSINLLIQKGQEASSKWLDSDKIKVFFE